MPNRAKSLPENAPGILARLVAISGSQSALGRALGLAPSYVTNWKHTGYIPTDYALDIHDLKLRDEYGTITAMDVLIEQRNVRRRLLREAGIDVG